LPCEAVIKQKFEIEKSNKLLNVDFSIDNCNPKIFDIIEYRFNIKSKLKALKVKSVTIIFNHQDRNKVKFYIILVIFSGEGLLFK
jgi:hypothetical protein